MAGQKGAASSPSTERGGNAAAYKVGAILSIRMHNFLTYSDAEVTPGPNLNVVVGPNGSGKSTILCAIALGLGAGAGLLERGDNVSEFVMRDKERGWVEIELKGENGTTHFIRRDLERAHNRSLWKYNGKSSTNKEIKAVVDELNIQIDNLCTFLPQEKVGKFTELNPQQLLTETELALSGTTLHKDHLKLIELQSGAQSQDKAKDVAEAELAKLEEQNRALEADKRKMEERQTKLEEVELMNKVLRWVEFEESRVRLGAAKDELKQLKRQVESAQEVLQPYTDKAAALQQKVSGADSVLKKVEQKQIKAASERQGDIKRGEDADVNLVAAVFKLNDLDDKRAKKEKDLVKAEAEVAKEQAKRDNFDADKVKEELADVKAEQRQVQSTRDVISRKKEEADARKQEADSALRVARNSLARLKDQGRQRRTTFQRSNMFGAADACEIQAWIEQNRQRFSGRVFGPVALEISVNDPKMAAAVESQLGSGTLVSFVVENNSDRNVLLSEWRDARKKKPTINVLGPNWMQEMRKSVFEEDQLAKLNGSDGIQGVLHDYIEGPPQVLAVLASQNNTKAALVGNGKTEDRIKSGKLLERLCGTVRGGNDDEEESGGRHSNCNIYTVVEGRGRGAFTTSFTGKVSKYSGKMTSSTKVITDPRVLGQGVGGDVENQIAELEEKVGQLQEDDKKADAEVGGFDKKMDKLNTDFNNLQRKVNDLQQQLRNRNGGEDKIKRLKDKVANLKRELSTDSEGQKGEIRKEIQKNTRNRVGCVVSIVNRVTSMRKMLEEKSGAKITLGISRNLHRHAQRELQEKTTEFRQLEADYNAKSKEVEQERKEAQRRKAAAMAVAELEGENADDAVKEKIMDLQEAGNNTSPHVQEIIDEAQAQADSIADNPEVLRQYQRRKAEIETKKVTLEKLRTDCESRQTQINKIKDTWETKLGNVVDKLHSRFSVYMSEMGCAGEVKLDLNEADYGSCGIKIRVKFRDQNELQDLKARVQSGGERSVSTILYLMALQDLMGSPFRAVDEINQGMDERNERLVFARIVANASKTQYFVVTPKLLPRLTSLEMPHVTVLFVFNAPALMDYTEWKMDKLLEAALAYKRRRSMSIGNGHHMVNSDRDDEEEEEEGGEHHGGSARGPSKKTRVA